MNGTIEYKGYEVIAKHNKKFISQIKDNLHLCEQRGQMGNDLMHEPPIRFVHETYDSMIEFMNENPR